MKNSLKFESINLAKFNDSKVPESSKIYGGGVSLTYEDYWTSVRHCQVIDHRLIDECPSGPNQE